MVEYLPLTDQQWSVIEQQLADASTTGMGEEARRRGRPRRDDREVLDAVLWVLQSGAIWDEVPREYASSSTAQRRYRDWVERGVWSVVWSVYWGTLSAPEMTDAQASQVGLWVSVLGSGKLVPVRVGTAVRVPSARDDAPSTL